MTDAPERIDVLIVNGQVHLPTGSGWTKAHMTPYILATPRPMSEAPRDGTRYLAWWPGDGQDGSGWISTWWMKNSNGWMCLWDFAAPDEPHAPTHFLPHPGEPK